MRRLTDADVGRSLPEVWEIVVRCRLPRLWEGRAGNHAAHAADRTRLSQRALPPPVPEADGESGL